MIFIIRVINQLSKALRLKYFTPKGEVDRFKSSIKILISEYVNFNDEDLKLIYSKSEIEIDNLKNDHTVQIAVTLFSLLPVIIINILLTLYNSIQNTTQTILKSIDIKLAVYSKDTSQVNPDKLINDVKTLSTTAYTSNFDILYELLKAISIAIFIILAYLMIWEAWRLYKIKKLSKRLYAIKTILEERSSKKKIIIIGNHNDLPQKGSV